MKCGGAGERLLSHISGNIRAYYSFPNDLVLAWLLSLLNEAHLHLPLACPCPLALACPHKLACLACLMLEPVGTRPT